MEIKLTQSMLKDYEREETCPKRFYHQWVEKEITQEPSLPMLKGSYFDFLCLGRNAHGESITDLPKNKNGSKTADQIRIEEQAELFRDMFVNTYSDEYLGKLKEYKDIVITDKQLKIADGECEGTLDFITTDATNGLILWDLKLTQDLTDKTPPWGWGNITQMDFTQQIHYYNIFKNTHGIEPLMKLIVFDYTTLKRVKIIDVIITDYSINLLKTRLEKLKLNLEKYERASGTGHMVLDRYGDGEGSAFIVDTELLGATNPSHRECGRCSLQCGARIRARGFTTDTIIV
jgi:hypothetical protein